MPHFVTTKPWTQRHKEWLLNTPTDQMHLIFNIIASTRKLEGLRDFIRMETAGCFHGLTTSNALARLREVTSVGDETARKIALFYFQVPFVIYDTYLLRFARRHGWISADTKGWTVEARKAIQRTVSNWLQHGDAEPHADRLKAIHALVNDCGNLWCKADEPQCAKCPLGVSMPGAAAAGNRGFSLPSS